MYAYSFLVSMSLLLSMALECFTDSSLVRNPLSLEIDNLAVYLSWGDLEMKAFAVGHPLVFSVHVYPHCCRCTSTILQMSCSGTQGIELISCHNLLDMSYFEPARLVVNLLHFDSNHLFNLSTLSYEVKMIAAVPASYYIG